MLLALLGNSMQAQNKLYGTVENNGKPLPYVTVRLLETDSTFVSGVTTDTLGKYVFSNIEKGNYLVALSSIGYKPAFIQIKMSDKNLEVPLVTLETENVVLGEVVVKGSSFIRKDDHVLVIPDKQQVKHASTGYDLLYNLMIPSIEVNKRTGTVSTFGGEVSLYINGEKADYRDVQSLRPRDIENVEYYDVPTGKYANDVAAINYIVKQYKAGGYIALDGKQNIGYLAGDYNVSSKINQGNTSYSVWGGYNMKDVEGAHIESSEKIYFPNYEVDRNRITADSKNRNNQQYAQLKISNSTQKHNISAQASFVRDDIPEESRSDLLSYSGKYTHSANSKEKKISESIQPSASLYGRFKLTKNQELEFKLKGTYSQNNYTRTYIEEKQTSLSDVEEDMYSMEFSGKYTMQMKKRNSLNVALYHLHNVSSSTYMGDYDSWQHLWSGETLLFLTYAQKWGKHLTMILSPGISMLNYKLHDENLQQYFYPRLRANLVYQPMKRHQIRLSASIGNSTPQRSLLNDIDQTVDFIQIQRGNPNMGTTKFYRADIIYSGLLGNLNLQTRFNYTGYIDNVFSQYYIEGDKLINNFYYGDNAHVLTANINLAYRISNGLRTKLSGSYSHNITTGYFPHSYNNVAGQLDINYFLNDFALNIYGGIQSDNFDVWKLAYTKSPATYGASVSWSHKGWYIEAGTENPFTRHSRYREHADYGVYQYNQVQTSRIYQRTGYVKLAYTFDFGRKTSRDKNDVDRSINSAIMKVN